MKKGTLQGIGCVVLFVTPFFIVGCVTTYLIAQHVVNSLGMQSWPTVPAVVLEAEAREVSKGDGTSWGISAAYEYTYEGRNYRGSRVGVDDSVGFGGILRKRAALLRDAHAKNETVPCHVNPNDPDEAVLFPQVHWIHLFFLGIVSLLFGGVGIGGYCALWFGVRKLRERDRLESLHPGQPWKWKPQWESGVIRSQSKAAMVGLWIFAGFWNAISAPIPFVLLEELPKGNKLGLLGLLFPLVGIGLLVAAARATLRWAKYGRTEFLMQSVPGVIGGELIGAVRIPQPVTFDGDVTLALRCLKKVTSGSGKSRSTSDRALWQNERKVDRGQIRIGPQTLVPVAFLIPFGCRESDEEHDIRWELQASGATPGLDFQARFEVPVFKTAESREDVTERSSLDPAAHADELQEAARMSRIDVRESTDGSIELDVPPVAARSVGFVLSLALFTILFTAASFLTVALEAPIFFPIVFGIVNLVLWLVLLQFLTGRKRAVVSAATAEVSSRFLCFWSRRTIPAQDVHRVEIPVTSRMQSGSRHYLYYSVRLFYRGTHKERHVDLADSIASKAEAEWIAAAVENALLSGE